MRKTARKKNIALLIDAENISANRIEMVMKKLEAIGTVKTRHVHGDWGEEKLAGWRRKLGTFALRPIQTCSHIAGKNSTDTNIIIDAMDLLHTKKYDAFALMTSDSDFTALALRIREDGLFVYGFGETKTPSLFQQAFSQFYILDNKVNSNKPKKCSNTIAVPDKIILKLKEKITRLADGNGWVSMSKLGKELAKTKDFSPTVYGFERISDMLKASDLFHVKMRNKTHMIIRCLN